MNSVLLAFLLLLQGISAGTTRGGMVEGRVVTADGTPAARTRVALQVVAESVAAAAEAPVLTSIGQTDEAGRYRLEGVTPGRYYIVAGRVDLPTYYPGAITQSEARVITVSDGSGLVGMDIALASAAAPGRLKVSGRVTREGMPGTPPLAQRVQLITIGVPATKTANIAPDGSFELTDVSPGAYLIGLTLSTALPPQRIEVRSMDVYIDLVEPLVAAIAGKITVDAEGPLPRVTLTFTESRSRLPVAGSFGTADSMTVLLRPGTYGVEWSALPAGYNVNSIVSGSTNLLTDLLRIEDGTPRTLSMTLGVSSPPPWVSVRGRIRSIATAFGRPTSGYAVIMTGADAVTLQTRANSDGTFEFPKVIPGSYTVRTNTAPRPDPFQITVGRNNVEDLVIVVPNFVEIAGQITVEGGGDLLPRPTFSVIDKAFVLGFTRAELQRNGSFTLALPPGRLQITLNPDSIRGYVVKEITYGPMNSLVEPITVDTSDAKTELRITLARRPSND